ncbi:MAG: molybdenum cofactor biosynthesis protein MoaE [Phycisphaeraceae bacterium]|nr:molybdenum cofactor biosynthesis protein MoaE [Phycisphaeraceae bacterium]
MKITVRIHDGPLAAAERWSVEGAGAVVCFDGIVRPTEAGQPIAGLSYETYDPMAERELARLALEAIERFGLLAVKVEHSRGQVDHGACSFRLRIASSHRKEALAAADWFIDRMKQQVPIWKKPVPVEQTEEMAR